LLKIDVGDRVIIGQSTSEQPEGYMSLRGLG
jgi:hypothetical protein